MRHLRRGKQLAGGSAARWAWIGGAAMMLLTAPVLGQDGAAAGGDAMVQVSLFEMFFIQRHPVTKDIELLGSLIIWLLLMLSAVCLGLIGMMAWENRRAVILPADFVGRTKQLLRARQVDEAREATRADGSFFAHVMHAALIESAHGHTAMVRAGEQTSEELTVKRLRRIEPLNVIGNVAPMIGLFGTVYGMIVAFREIVIAGGTPDPVSLAAGIGTALTTTFWGLIVAIPALAGYAFLRNSIDGLTVEAARTAEEMVNEFRPAGRSGEPRA